jgi:hypothetical protein
MKALKQFPHSKGELGYLRGHAFGFLDVLSKHNRSANEQPRPRNFARKQPADGRRYG